MADLVTRLKLANSEFNQNIDSSKKKVHELQDTADDASKSLKDMGDKGAQAGADLLKEMSKMEQGGRSVSNYRQQLAQLQRQIVDLTVNYRSMSKEMQQSAKGMEIKALLDEATAQASVFKDAIGDVQQEIQKMASDTAPWDSLKMGVETVSAALQGFISTGVLGEKTTEQLVEVIAKLQAVEKTTNAVIKIGNALQKNSALMTGITRIQTAALARAKVAETAATKGATIAQKLFNKVAMANPYVLLAAAVITVVTALAAFTLGTKKAKEEEEKAQQAHEEYMNSMSDSISKMGDAAYNFDTLAKKYKECRTEAEKQQFLKDYKSKLDDLGISVNDINGLEKVFVEKTDEFRRACILRAQAMGLESMQADKYKQMMSEVIKARDLAAEAGGNTRVNEGTPLFEMLKEYGVYDKMVKRWGKDYVITTNDVLNDLEAAIRKKFAGITQEISDEQKKLEDQVKDLDLGNAFNFSGKGNSGTPTPTTTGGKDKPQRIADDGTKKQLQDRLSLLQQDLAYMKAGTDEWKNQLAEIEKVKAEIKEITDAEAAFTNRLNNPIEPLEMPIMPKLEGKIELPKQTLKVPVKMSPEDMVNAYKEAQNKAGEISEYVKVGAITPQQAAVMIDSLNKQLEAAGITAKVELELETSKAVKQMDAFVAKMDQVGSVGNAVGAINSVYESISQLGDKLSEAKNGWEAFFAIFQTGMTIFNAVATIIETVATVTELLTAAKTANAAATTSEAAAATADAAAQGADAGATITNAAAHGAAAAASAGQSVASIPIAGPVLAIAAIASVMAAIIGMIASAKGFANGGIVDAPSKIGDKNLIRVNGGEAVLNERQQANLFKMLDEGRVERHSNLGGEVEFKIRGTELVGVLNNINRKNSKI